MPLSYKNYTGNNSTTTFSIPFTFAATNEISVTVNGVAQSNLSFPSSSQVQLTSAPASGAVVQLRRTTNLAARAVDFASGSVLTEEDLDNSNIQIFHSSQEAVDLTDDSVNLGTDDKWDMESKVVKNVANPTSAQDAATKNYLETVWLSPADKTVITNVNNNITPITNVNNSLSVITAVNNNASNINSASANATLAENYAVKVDAAVEASPNRYSSKAWAIGGVGVTDVAGSGSAMSWAVEADTVDGSEFSSKVYAGSGSTLNVGSAKNWAIGGGDSFATSTAVGTTGEYSAKYWAGQAAASKTEFSNVYQGTASTDPTGGSVSAGDLYFNSSTNRLKFYNGSNWANIEATDTSSFASNGFSVAMAIAL